jgi:FBP C-terminal treble-clef zinc-finger
MKPLDADEIRGSFVNSTRGEMKRMSLPPNLAGTGWDDLDFLGWIDPGARERAYLVLPADAAPVGVALRAAAGRSSRLRSAICQFCVTAHAVSDITLFSATVAGPLGRQGNVVGTYLCADLACSLYVRGKRRAAVPQPGETLTTEDRVTRLVENARRFVDRVTTPR